MKSRTYINALLSFINLPRLSNCHNFISQFSLFLPYRKIVLGFTPGTRPQLCKICWVQVAPTQRQIATRNMVQIQLFLQFGQIGLKFKVRQKEGSKLQRTLPVCAKRRHHIIQTRSLINIGYTRSTISPQVRTSCTFLLRQLQKLGWMCYTDASPLRGTAAAGARPAWTVSVICYRAAQQNANVLLLRY